MKFPLKPQLARVCDRETPPTPFFPGPDAFPTGEEGALARKFSHAKVNLNLYSGHGVLRDSPWPLLRVAG